MPQSSLKEPLHFAPYLKSVIWGGDRIAPFKGISTDLANVGESWEISSVEGHVSVVDQGPLAGMTLTQLIEKFGADLVGADIYERFGTEFPLLIKLIDARQDLSVQVHPDDRLAAERHGCKGKTEMWHIIETSPGALIHVGLSERITPAEYERRVADDTIMDVVASYPSQPGDTFFLPAGRIHAIGAGNLLAEIQQTSDITYRIYDFGRTDKDGNPRELHTEQARDAIDYTVYPTYKSEPAGSLLAECAYFTVDRLDPGSEPVRMPSRRPSFAIAVGLSGCAQLEGPSGPDGAPAWTCTLPQGHTLLVPAVSAGEVYAKGPASLLWVNA